MLAISGIWSEHNFEDDAQMWWPERQYSFKDNKKLIDNNEMIQNLMARLLMRQRHVDVSESI